MSAASVNLHELAAQPGYGSARKALREAGAWVEIDEETGLPLWTVEVEWWSPDTDCFTVAARDEAAAREAAEALCKTETGAEHVEAGFASPARAASAPWPAAPSPSTRKEPDHD